MYVSRRSFLVASATLPAMMTATRPVGAATADGRYRACIIGDTKQGGYGHSLHLGFATRDDVDIVGLADPDESGRAKMAAEAKAARTYADYREMLEKETPDLVIVGPRWTVNHRDYLLAAADVGAHGFMEKPIHHNLADADAMIAAIEAKNLKWSIAFNFRVLPIVEHARKLVMDEKIIGEVLEVRGRGKEDARAGGEDLLVLGTHIMDLMRFFLGNPQWCFGDICVGGRAATKADVREATEPLGPIMGDRVHAVYGFDNGVVGYFASTKNPENGGGRWGLDIFGTKGIVTIRSDVAMPVKMILESTWAPGGRESAWQDLPDVPDAPTQPAPDIRNAPITNDLIAAIKEDRLPKVSLQDGRASLEMIQAVYESHLRGARVEFPLNERRHPLL